MSFGFPPTLASIAAVRPVFMIVMGISLAVVAWRLARSSSGWTARLIVAGAFLLGFGYTLVMPLYEAGRIPRHNGSATAVAGQVVKSVAMNGGWLLLGLGLALHARVFTPTAPRRKLSPTPLDARETVA